jgi:transcriptional regulator with XRE-family HTH domain
MKKYQTLGELLIDFRKHRNMSQFDFAALLDVDARTVIRWEKNESLIKGEKERLLTSVFGIPHQVLRNLNSDKPISIYFDFNKWAYSLSSLSTMIGKSSEFITDMELDTDRIKTIENEKDIEFITYIQKNQKNCTPLQPEVIKTAAKLLPGLNFVIDGQSGYHAGHISVLPLKYIAYIKLRDRVIREDELQETDLTINPADGKLVFYYYSLYANSIDNIQFLMNRLFTYFKTKKYTDYIFAGISYRKHKVDLLREIGLKVIWEEQQKEDCDTTATFVAGNFDKFLFGK